MKSIAIIAAGLFAVSAFAQSPAAKKDEKKAAPAAAAPAKKEEAKPAAPAAKKDEKKAEAKK